MIFSSFEPSYLTCKKFSISFVLIHSVVTGCRKPVSGDIGKRNSYSKELCLGLWNYSFGATYWQKEC